MSKFKKIIINTKKQTEIEKSLCKLNRFAKIYINTNYSRVSTSKSADI